MRVPVLTMLPRQESLAASARAKSIQETRSSLGQAKTPSRMELDLNFPAVPVGTGRPETMVAENMGPDDSEQFVVRGEVEVDNLEDMPEEVDGQRLFADPKISHFLTCGGTSPVGTAQTVAGKLNVSKLKEMELDGKDVAIAILDTGINLNHLRNQLGSTPRLDAANSWRPAGTTTQPGGHAVDHGTMCAYDALIAAPKAALLDLPILSSSAPGSSSVSGTLSVALLAFANLLAGWAVAFAPGGAARYRGLVVNNSWGVYHPSWDFPVGHRGRYIDNPQHPFNLIAGTLAGSGADILFAAGNCGAQCSDTRCQNRTTGTIMGANAHASVLTVAGCDTNDQRVGYSSQGPSIAGMFQQKPDVTCYTHFLGSEAFGQGSADSGTSAATPVAAGCIAAVRTKVSPTHEPPTNLIAQVHATARQLPNQTGWNGDVGHGILDPVSLAQSLGV